ncbi:MAG: 16S rRNA (cytidine(1402)-2'-O)-methyltransferase [Deltaproteobacteria bacterium]|nr:16S rRNA (cytidine(1402)-2'-O)-methyltransferase [Deltaproteobacteria bacterium]
MNGIKPARGILYVVATPIGNLEDMTLRAIRILKEVGLIAAEDTRRTRHLLNAFGIQTPLVSLHDWNEQKRSVALVERTIEGVDVAYVSDAGTPGISDPGYRLINEAIGQGIRVIPIPGVSAVITALCASGLPMDHFIFRGFIPSKTSLRQQFLGSIKNEPGTLVVYESPRRLPATLRDMESILGRDRRIVIAREMTKAFEEIQRGTVGELIETLSGRTFKGEISLVIAGRKETKPSATEEEIQGQYRSLLADPNLSRRDRIARVARQLGVSRRQVYQLILREGSGGT